MRLTYKKLFSTSFISVAIIFVCKVIAAIFFLKSSNDYQLNDYQLNYSPRNGQSSYFLTLFTTFKNDNATTILYANTIRNWANFGAEVNLILFSTGLQQLEDLASSQGWRVRPISHSNEHGTPYLLSMVNITQHDYSSIISGYSNGDIMFDDSLIKTLKAVVNQLAPPLLIVGRRTNVFVNESVEFNADTISILLERGKLYRTDAEDYFFYVKFPWHKIPNFVIGRAGYDNYIVDKAVRLGVKVVDATQTITALHQQLIKPDDPYRLKETDYSFNKKLFGHFHSFKYGFTSSVPYETNLINSSFIVVNKRRQ